MKKTIVALAIALAGCTSKPIKVAEFGGERRITVTDVVRVQISEADKTRIDPVFMLLGQQQAETGPIWSQVFIGSDVDPLLSIESAELRYSVEAAGFAGRYTYSMSGTLSHNGVAYPISATGSRGFAMNINSAMRQAVELAVVDAAKQCQDLVSNKME